MANEFDDDLEDDFDDDDFEDDEDELEEDETDDDIGEDDELVDEEDEEESTEETSESDDDEDILDLEEELHPDDVEAPLDALLQERVTAGSLDDDDDEDEILGESGTTKVIPRRDTEFHCSSCFLVLPNHMLADKKKMLCRDCA